MSDQLSSKALQPPQQDQLPLSDQREQKIELVAVPR